MPITDNEFIHIRKTLHAHPELSGHEVATARRIASWLSKYQPDTLIENVGGTGILAIYEGKVPGPVTLFRAELDALPIQEINTFDHRSHYLNISHKCGHDGHATILLALSKKLHEQPINKGRVVLLFQPAEENGSGARAVLADTKFQKLQPDFIFALHNLPGYPLHQVVLKKAFFTASVISMTIRLQGKTAHAAEPENGINPAMAISEILTTVNTMDNNTPEASDFSVITPVHVSLGSIDYGISAGYGEVHLTLRTWSADQLDSLCEQVKDQTKSIAQKHGIDARVDTHHHFVANHNHDESVELIRQAATENQLSVLDSPTPFKWGEDFGLFTQYFKGAMFGLGAGTDQPSLHNPDYDFPDELIETGALLFYSIAQKLNQ